MSEKQKEHPFLEHGYNFVEWPDETLEARLDVLMDLDEGVRHGRARSHQLCREIAHLCFELEFRYELPLD